MKDQHNNDLLLEQEHLLNEQNNEHEEVNSLSTFARIKYLFIKPSLTMEDLAKRPRILFPLITIVLLVFISEIMLRNLSETYQSIELITEPILKYLTLALLILFPLSVHLVIWFGKSLFVYMFTTILGGKGTFKGVASVIGYSYLINVLGEVIRATISLVRGVVLPTTSFIAFFPNLEAGTPLFIVLQALNIFTLIYLGLGTIGVVYVQKISTIKSAIVLYGTWIVMVLVQVLTITTGV